MITSSGLVLGLTVYAILLGFAANSGAVLAGAANASDAFVLPAPKIFAPGVISGPGNDGTPTFSPDGRTLYFYRYGTAPTSAVILESHRDGAEWSEPIVAPFSGPSPDRQPAFSPDGRTLVYVSLRQVSASSGDARQYASSLWRVVRTASGWSAPERLPDAVNISQRMHNPSIAANGDLYFTCPTTRPGRDQTWGLYRAAYRNGSYERAQALSFSDGEVLDADDPAIAPDQSYLIFGSHGLRPPLGEELLFITFRRGTSWGPAIQIRYDGDDWLATASRRLARTERRCISTRHARCRLTWTEPAPSFSRIQRASTYGTTATATFGRCR
jgi:hypothetical protein